MPLPATILPERSTDTNADMPYCDSDVAGTVFYSPWLGNISDIAETPSLEIVQFEDILSRKFFQLADEWHCDTDYISSPTRRKNHRAYRKILAMGMNAVPFILRDLRDRGGDWYEALVDITGESPIPADIQGDVRRMNEIWLRWGRERGLID